MEFIAHRINTIDELNNTPPSMGIEVDLRDNNGEIIIQHDPFKDGEYFENYLKHYNHGTLILNIKSERIEYRVLELIKKYSITDYFFLDSSFPMIKSLIDLGESNIALRYSEYEGIDTIVNLTHKVKWVWVDCFSKLPITKETYTILKNCGYKLCLVSPELQSQGNKIKEYRDYLYQSEIKFDAICTKLDKVNSWII